MSKIISPIEKAIRENISNPSSVFVFPTQTAADMWAEKITEDEQHRSVAMEQFAAWDDFKGRSIKSRNQDKTSIPSLMRQVFAANLIQQNAQNPFLASIIQPDFASDASGFTKWVAKLLPSLRAWKEMSPDESEWDEEDRDFSNIYGRYKEFLDAHGLFDPAWETPPFEDDGHEYFIIYPEVLMDYSEYKGILESSPKIHLVSTKSIEKTEKIRAKFYENSRVELRETALLIRNLHDKDGIPWARIALSVPDLETFAPYIERELSLYSVPFSMRTGRNLSETAAGSFFVQAQECVQNDFSLESVRNLLMNNALPWKDQKLNERLVEFGKDKTCICSYRYGGKHVDVWEESFEDWLWRARKLSELYNGLGADVPDGEAIGREDFTRAFGIVSGDEEKWKKVVEFFDGRHHPLPEGIGAEEFASHNEKYAKLDEKELRRLYETLRFMLQGKVGRGTFEEIYANSFSAHRTEIESFLAEKGVPIGKNADGREFSEAALKAFRKDEKSAREFFAGIGQEIPQGLVTADSFAEINKSYFRFKSYFFDMNKCDGKSDRIISRCIKELGTLGELEQDFPDCPVPNPFQFFTSHLSETPYVMKSETSGVQVFAYRAAVASPFDAQIVIDASQDSVSVSSLYKRMSFLNEMKRSRLGIEDIDPTEDFLRIYGMSEKAESSFSAAAKTFGGYAFLHGMLEPENLIPEPSKGIIPEMGYDIYGEEKDALLQTDERDFVLYRRKSAGIGKPSYPAFLFGEMGRGFSTWKNTAEKIDGGASKEKIRAAVMAKLWDDERKRIKVSQSALKLFFKCPRLWLYRAILNLEAPDNEALLIERFTMGNVYHQILDTFCQKLKNKTENGVKGIPLRTENGALDQTRLALLMDSIDETLKTFRANHIPKMLLLTDRAAITEQMVKTVTEFSKEFDGLFIAETEQTYDYMPEGKNYFLSGKIDCLLFDKTSGDFTLIDYKSTAGSIPAKNLYADGPDSVPDPQIPMYKTILENQGNGTAEKVTAAAFYNIKDAKATFVFGNNSKKTPDDFGATIERFIDMADEYAERIAACDFGITDEAQTYQTCAASDCSDYRAICRRFFNVNRK